MKQEKRQHYKFWRWLILSIVDKPKLYVLVWGILFIAAAALFKTDIISVIARLWP